MNIGFTGCSYTTGAELTEPKQTRWSKLVCNKLSAKEHNFAVSGSSNEMICMTSFEKVKEVKLDFLVVQLTSCVRFSLASDDMILAISPNQVSRNLREELICKVAYSKNHSYQSWYKLFRWKAVALHHFLNENNVNHMFMFMMDFESQEIYKDEYVPSSFKDKSVFVGIREYCSERKLPIGKWLHPLEEAQTVIAN
jgi:hypothetical protein